MTSRLLREIQEIYMKQSDEVISWMKKSYHTRHYSMWNFARLCLLIKKSASLFFLLSSQFCGSGGTSKIDWVSQIKICNSYN